MFYAKDFEKKKNVEIGGADAHERESKGLKKLSITDYSVVTPSGRNLKKKKARKIHESSSGYFQRQPFGKKIQIDDTTLQQKNRLSGLIFFIHRNRWKIQSEISKSPVIMWSFWVPLATISTGFIDLWTWPFTYSKHSGLEVIA